MDIALYTLGCKVNSYESESVWEQFLLHGHKRVTLDDSPDVIIINTCTVTNNGDVKSRKAIRQAHSNHPDAILVVMGCYSQLAVDEIQAIDGVDIVLGTTKRNLVYDFVMAYKKDQRPIQTIDEVQSHTQFEDIHVSHFTDQTRAYLKIQDGCNNYCSYCIIPYARGPVRSKELHDVISEAKSLLANGYKELVLTGIHTGGYGQDLDVEFDDLVEKLIQLNGLKRLRISSIEINEVSNHLLDMIKHSAIIVPHLHIPIQSGSDAVLQQMRRKYSLAEFKKRIHEIKSNIPNIAISTDVIVGFPNETDKDHQTTLSTLKELEFSELHVFPYSKRDGTKAASLPQINGKIVKKRAKQVRELGEILANKYIAKQEEVLVLFEQSDATYTYGHTDTYITVKVKKDLRLHNTIQHVLLKKKEYNNTFGTIVK